jgi:pilus assembly protein FimV
MGLGQIDVSSYLNQRLKAKVEVYSDNPNILTDFEVYLASKKAYKKAGMKRPFYLTKLKFLTKRQNNKNYIFISSRSLIREQFIELLLEIDSVEGHVLKRFNILLDMYRFKKLN